MIYLLTAIYFLWLLAVLFFFGFTPTADGEGYIDYAQKALAQHQPYPTATLFREIPFVWNIGIINLTELSLWLFGSLTPLLVSLCLMKSGTALFMALTTQKLFGHRVAVVALLLFMLYPNNWGQSTMVSSEIPSTFLCVLAMFLAVSGTHGANGTHGTYGAHGAYGAYEANSKTFFLAGWLLALANWFRPTATIFILAIIVFLFVIDRKRIIGSAARLLSGYALFIAIVGTSTYLRTGHFLYQSHSYWFSMVDECYDGAAVAPHWGQPVWPEGTPRYIDNREGMDCFDYERIWRERSLDWLKDHKAAYLSKVPGRLFYLYQSDYDNMPAFLSNKSQAENNFITLPYRHLPSEVHTLNAAQWLSLVCWLFYLVLLAMALIGIIKMLRRRHYKELLLPLSVVVGGSFLLVLVMHGETRFKDPLMPCLFMLAATSLSLTINKKPLKR